MKAETAFNYLVKNRNAAIQQAAEARPYIVRSLTKKGDFSKADPHPLNCCATLEAAEARLALMAKMNPSMKFGIDG